MWVRHEHRDEALGVIKIRIKPCAFPFAGENRRHAMVDWNNEGSSGNGKDTERSGRRKNGMFGRRIYLNIGFIINGGEGKYGIVIQREAVRQFLFAFSFHS